MGFDSSVTQCAIVTAATLKVHYLTAANLRLLANCCVYVRRIIDQSIYTVGE